MHLKSIIFYIFLLFSSITCGCHHNTCDNSCDDTGPVKDTFFKSLGKYRGKDKCGVTYKKAYYYPRYLKTSWIEAKMICKTYNLELASFKTLEEAQTVMEMVENNADLKIIHFLWIYLDGIALTFRSKTDWYWTDSGKKVDFSMPWLVNQPDTLGDVELFLSIGRHVPSQNVGFNDVPGKNFDNMFLCQKYIY